MALKDKTIASAYKDLLEFDNSNNGISNTGTVVKDGAGTSSCLTLGKDRLVVRPTVSENVASFQVRALDGTTLFYVDSVNQDVRSGASQIRINTNQHIFSTFDEQPTAGYWYPLIASHYGVSYDPANWGNSAEPNISSDSEQIIPILFYTTAAIKVTSVNLIAQTESAATVDARLYKYDMVSGSGSTAGNLTNGERIAHLSSAYTTGDDRISTTSLTISSAAGVANAAGGQVLVGFIKEDSTTHDITGQLVVKYHYT